MPDSSPQTTETTTRPPEDFLAALRGGLGTATATFDPTLAQLLTGTGTRNLLTDVEGLRGLIPSASAAYESLVSDPSRLLTDPSTTAAIEAATRPLYQQLTENILPSIQDQFVGAGQQGSARQGVAEGLATERTTRAAGDVTSQLVSNILQQGRQQQLQAALGLSQFGAGTLLPSQALTDTGSNLVNQYIQQLATLSGAAGGTQTATTTGGGPSTFDRLLQTGLTAAAFL